MAKLSFFQVLISNIKCAFCGKTKCHVRFLPGRKEYFIHGDTRYVRECEKDKKIREKSLLK